MCDIFGDEVDDVLDKTWYYRHTFCEFYLDDVRNDFAKSASFTGFSYYFFAQKRLGCWDWAKWRERELGVSDERERERRERWEGEKPWFPYVVNVIVLSLKLAAVVGWFFWLRDSGVSEIRWETNSQCNTYFSNTRLTMIPLKIKRYSFPCCRTETKTNRT